MARPKSAVPRFAITIKVTAEQRAQLTALAGLEGVSRTELALRAVTLGLNVAPALESAEPLLITHRGVPLIAIALRNPEHAQIVTSFLEGFNHVESDRDQ